jgi:hypothetical protein
LKFSIPQIFPPIEDIIVDIEAGIKNFPENIKNDIRSDCREILHQESQHIIRYQSQPAKTIRKNLKDLRSLDCYYVKADKGNKIVIIKKDYNDVQMQNLIDEGPYEKIQSYPLEDANKAVKRVVKNLTKLTVVEN